MQSPVVVPHSLPHTTHAYTRRALRLHVSTYERAVGLALAPCWCTRWPPATKAYRRSRWGVTPSSTPLLPVPAAAAAAIVFERGLSRTARCSGSCDFDLIYNVDFDDGIIVDDDVGTHSANVTVFSRLVTHFAHSPACSGPERLGHFMDRSMMALRDGSHMYTPPNAPGATRSVQDMARPAHLWHLTRLQL